MQTKIDLPRAGSLPNIPCTFEDRLRNCMSFKTTFISLITLSLVFSTAVAAEGPISFAHQPPTLAELPPPGRSLTLFAYLKNSADASLPVRAIIVKDGRMMMIDPTKVYRNEYDQATFEFKIYAPVAEISYQFVLSNKGGQLITSTNFKLRRTCLPEVSVKVEKPPGPAGVQINAMLEQAKGLEIELKTWEHAAKALDELKAALAALHPSKKEKAEEVQQ